MFFKLVFVEVSEYFSEYFIEFVFKIFIHVFLCDTFILKLLQLLLHLYRHSCKLQDIHSVGSKVLHYIFYMRSSAIIYLNTKS